MKTVLMFLFVLFFFKKKEKKRFGGFTSVVRTISDNHAGGNTQTYDMRVDNIQKKKSIEIKKASIN